MAVEILNIQHFDDLIGLTPTGDFIPKHCKYYLLKGFRWASSEEGDKYWSNIYTGLAPYTEEDRSSLIKQSSRDYILLNTTVEEDIWL